MDKDSLHSCKPPCSAALNRVGYEPHILNTFGDCLRQKLSRLICDNKACEILRSLHSLRMTEGRHSEHCSVILSEAKNLLHKVDPSGFALRMTEQCSE